MRASAVIDTGAILALLDLNDLWHEPSVRRNKITNKLTGLLKDSGKIVVTAALNCPSSK